ncbi:hypothetical protein COO60DRAFT_437512 [Scenedesmus sp. NREL 46B-D3]|nr:hypothetical protein COO60DRAFT_437512 [Scenedesmus sp. NREL 46B-D3]
MSSVLLWWPACLCCGCSLTFLGPVGLVLRRPFRGYGMLCELSSSPLVTADRTGLCCFLHAAARCVVLPCFVCMQLRRGAH